MLVCLFRPTEIIISMLDKSVYILFIENHYWSVSKTYCQWLCNWNSSNQFQIRNAQLFAI